jgi:general secretion pathway protein G
MKAKSGFTLIEILIVVVILGILAAIVIPQFTDASTEAKTSSLCSDLQTMRSQIELYKVQHNDALPGGGGATFTEALTGYTDIDGDVQAAAGAGVYGPYLQKIPTNQFVDSNGIDMTGTPGNDSGSGWDFNTTTGAFYADDSAHSTL